MSEEVKSVLERLKEINESKSNNIYLPSIGKKCKFSPFTLKQQKDLLSKLPDDATGILDFNNNFNSIITNNCREDISLDSINNFDRLSVIVNYRMNAVGSTLEVNEKKINLGNISKAFESTNFDKIFGEKEIKTANYKAIIQMPSLSYDHKINVSTTFKLKKAKKQQEIIAELFVAEVLKYVKSVTVDEDNTMDMVNSSYEEKTNVIELLPNSFTKKIFDFIASVKTVEDKITTVEDTKIDISNELFG